MNDPITGPVPREKFVEAVSAPYGQAQKIIREFDPLWGLAEGEEIEWKVKAKISYPARGTATVRAAGVKEAEAKVDELTFDDFDWDDLDDFEIVSVEPASVRARP